MISARELRKVYGSRVAVDGISFEVEQGEVFGFLGPNGAGKTTTIRMLAGLTRPTSGFGLVAGYDVRKNPMEVHRNIGMVFEKPNLYERLSVEDNLSLFASFYGVDRKRVREVMEQVDIADRRRDPVGKLSKGLQQRVLIGRAILHKPKVLFLDEPSSGLDPNSAAVVRDVIRDLKNSGMTVFLTTHYMEEADELSDRVAFLVSGKIVALDSPYNLKLKYGRRAMTVDLKDESAPEGIRSVELPLDDPASGDRIREFIEAGTLLRVHTREAALADIFIELTGRELS